MSHEPAHQLTQDVHPPRVENVPVTSLNACSPYAVVSGRELGYTLGDAQHVLLGVLTTGHTICIPTIRDGAKRETDVPFILKRRAHQRRGGVRERADIHKNTENLICGRIRGRRCLSNDQLISSCGWRRGAATACGD